MRVSKAKHENFDQCDILSTFPFRIKGLKMLQYSSALPKNRQPPAPKLPRNNPLCGHQIRIDQSCKDSLIDPPALLISYLIRAFYHG